VGNRSAAEQRGNIVVLDKIDIIVIIELRRAGAFVARMWLSKSKLPQASLRPFLFLTANPGKP